MHFAPIGSWQVLNEEGRRKYVSAEERLRFLTVADSYPLLLRALAYVLAYSGCRVSEALALSGQQIDFESEKLVFRTLKRRKLTFRATPVPSEIIEMLGALHPIDDQRIWKMHRTTAFRQIKTIMVEAQIEGPMACCRGLRHGYGIMAATAKVPPNLITKFMGHADSSTTAIYLDAVGWEEREFASLMWRKDSHLTGIHAPDRRHKRVGRHVSPKVG